MQNIALEYLHGYFASLGREFKSRKLNLSVTVAFHGAIGNITDLVDCHTYTFCDQKDYEMIL